MTAEAVPIPFATTLQAAPRLSGVGTALPKNRYDQRQLFDALKAVWARQHYNVERLERLHYAVDVGTRHLALPLEAYGELAGFARSSEAFAEVGTQLGADAARDALEAAGRRADEVDAIFFTTVTGVSTPSLDVRLANVLPLRSDVCRTPMFGLGCVGGAAGLARMSDYLRGYPEGVAMLVSVELCSLTLQREDLSIENFIATGLFGDGAAAVVGTGAAFGDGGRPRPAAPQALAHRSVLYPDTEWVMGWKVQDSGFKVVLSGQLPQIIEERIGDDVDAFLADSGLQRGDITHWVCHPGGPKVMMALEAALELPDDALDSSRALLRRAGNLSSASVLHVLAEVDGRARSGDYGLLMAMGPGFCAELMLLRW